jgi:hypothetical protein
MNSLSISQLSLAGLLLSIPTIAQTTPTIDATVNYNPPNPPVTRDSKDTNPGGSPQPVCLENERSCIPYTENPLTALIYVYEEDREAEIDIDQVPIVWGQTQINEPTLFFYLPYEPESYDALVFRLDDYENRREIIPEQPVMVSESPGIIGITFPEGTVLEKNVNYRWSLIVEFVPGGNSSDIVVSGRIQKTELSEETSSELQKATSVLERADILGEAGIWYDMLAELALNHSESRDAWSRLLQASGLAGILSADIVDYYQLQSQFPNNE